MDLHSLLTTILFPGGPISEGILAVAPVVVELVGLWIACASLYVGASASLLFIARETPALAWIRELPILLWLTEATFSWAGTLIISLFVFDYLGGEFPVEAIGYWRRPCGMPV